MQNIIWDTNAYTRYGKDGQEYEVIYRMGARFNHACVPNCKTTDGETFDESFLQIYRDVQV
jgi:hypothetical protein